MEKLKKTKKIALSVKNETLFNMWLHKEDISFGAVMIGGGLMWLAAGLFNVGILPEISAGAVAISGVGAALTGIALGCTLE